MDFEIEHMYKLAHQSKLSGEHISHILEHGFNDYNNDYNNEIRFIIKAILKNDRYTIQSSEIPKLVNLIGFHDNALFKDFFDRMVRNNIAISEDCFELILNKKFFNLDVNSNYIKTIENSRDNFINYTLNQNTFNLEELQLLKIFTQHKEVAEKILFKENLQFSEPLYNYLKEHYKYKNLIEDKKIELIPSNDISIAHLAKELVLTENYMHDFFKKEVQYDKTYLNNFFSKTYSMIFDKNNTNRDKFSVDFVKKQLQISVDSMNYSPSFTQKTIEDMRKNYSGTHPFAKLKK